MDQQYVVVIEWDNGDPEVHGPEDSEQEAELLKSALVKRMDDWERRHTTNVSVRQLICHRIIPR